MGTFHFKHYDDKRLRLVSSFCTKGTVLDLGYAQAPNPYLDSTLTTGVDLNPNTTDTRYARELVGDIREIDRVVGASRFDNIVAGELIEHLEDPYAFLGSLQPLLKPGGRLILSTPNPIGWPTLLLELVRSKRFFYTDEHKHYFPPRWVERILDHCGYHVDVVKGVGLWMPVLVPPCPATISYQVVYVARAD